MGIVVILIVVITVGVVVAFLRAVFGGSTFGRSRRQRGRKDDDAGRGPRADAHPGTRHWPAGGTSFGQWGPGGSGG